jgi:hypothetical protein
MVGKLAARLVRCRARRRKSERQGAWFVTADALPKSPGPACTRALHGIHAERVIPHDREARITKLKDDATHPAVHAEHVVALDRDLLLAAAIRPATEHDSRRPSDGVRPARQPPRSIDTERLIAGLAADKGDDSAGRLEPCRRLHFRSEIPEPKRHTDGT